MMHKIGVVDLQQFSTLEATPSKNSYSACYDELEKISGCFLWRCVGFEY
ncbi:MAG: hypothetical protein IPM04_08490 [Saprospiraceae bacterium]|nr:hypothetical protein [Candidatus Brachybacter algidus]